MEPTAGGWAAFTCQPTELGEPGISQEVRQVLNIPQNIDPITIIPLGYPDEIPEPKMLRPLEEMTCYETFRRE